VLTAVIGLFVLLLAAGLLIPALRERFTTPPKHVAVLPFDNVGDNPENQVLIAGLMDSLSGKLSNLDLGNQSLWVIPASEVRRRNITDAAAALRDLGATLVVKGSVQRDGKDVRMNVSLIDTKNMRQVGSAELDDPAGDLAVLQNDAVSQLARMMNINVSSQMLRDARGSVSPAAYEDYLSALGYMQRYDKPGNLDQAIQVLQNSVRTDPNFALGYAQLGEAYRLKYNVDKSPKWIEEAQAACQKAAELDGRLPAAYVTLGRLHQNAGNQDLAMQEFQRALDINPHDDLALRGLGAVYEASGRIPEAEAAFKKGAALRPEYWDGYDELGNFYDRQGRYPEAIQQYQHALTLTPDNAQLYLNLGATYADTGDPRQRSNAEQALQKSISLTPSYAAYANLGNVYLTQQRYAEAAAATEKALQLDANDYNVWSNLILAYDWMGDKAKADTARKKMLSLLQQAIKLKPQDASAQAMIATLYAHDHDNEKTLGHVQTALALAPDDPGVLSDVGEAYEIMGDRHRAIDYIRKALQKGYALDQLKADFALQGLLADPSFATAK
jgi:serine/threonine-protein kinase